MTRRAALLLPFLLAAFAPAAEPKPDAAAVEFFEKKVRPVTTQERIVVGAKVPTSVELEAVPADWGPSVSKYRYVYSNNRVMLVDPGTRTVVHEID